MAAVSNICVYCPFIRYNFYLYELIICLIWLLFSMKFFDNLEWVGYSHRPACVAWVDKVFPDYWVLDYNHSGEIPLQINDGPIIKLRGPVAWFTFPGPRIRFGSLTHSWNHSFAAFRGERVKRYLDEGLIAFDPLNPTIAISDPQRFLRSMRALVDYLDSPTYGHTRSVQMLDELLLQLHEQQKDGYPVHPSAEVIRELIDRIEEQPEDAYDFKDLAKGMSLSYTHFRRLFTQLAGYSPQQLIVRKRIAKARRLLRAGVEIKAICAELGYSDVYHFSKQFKMITGLPPGRFRSSSQL